MIHVKHVKDGKQPVQILPVCMQIIVQILILGNHSSNDGSRSQRQKYRNGQLDRGEKFKYRGMLPGIHYFSNMG